jgi:hypothetical protein
MPQAHAAGDKMIETFEQLASNLGASAGREKKIE